MKFIKLGFCVVFVTMLGYGVTNMVKQMNTAKSGLEMIIKDKLQGRY